MLICAHCGEQTDHRPEGEDCPACGEPMLLDEAYELLEIVGRGAVGTTYRARRVVDDKELAIKELLFHRLDSLKTKELFFREARVLSQLDHPGVPDYIDQLTVDAGRSVSFYLVQEFIDGETLEEDARTSRYTEDEVWAVVVELLHIVDYLHGLHPPVIHRDIKPSNIMRRAAGRDLVLIDFGSVRDALRVDEGQGSTVAGTFGFMPPEQFRGDAVRASDLYGIAATAVALLTGQQPHRLMDNQHRIQWEDAVEIDPDFKAVLRRMLDPDPQRRGTASGLLEELTAPPPKTPPVEPKEPPRARPDRSVPLDRPAYIDESARPSRSDDEDRAAMQKVLGALAVGGVAMIFLCVAIVDQPGYSSSDHSSTEVIYVDEAPCTGPKCGQAPRDVAYFTLGMTAEEAREAAPEAADWREIRPEHVSTRETPIRSLQIDELMDSASGNALPGERYSTRVLIEDHLATCNLSFVIDEVLSRIVCEFDAMDSRQERNNVIRSIREPLEATYGGVPRIIHDPLRPSFDQDPHQWSDDEAIFTLTSEVSPNSIVPPSALLGGRVHVELVSREHQRLRERTIREARRAEEQERREAEEQRARERELEMERLRVP